MMMCFFFFFNDTATTEIYTLSLHDALPILRVIADHSRATTFLMADGILPGNEGRSYVLRKIMRRAIYQGRQALGFDGLFFHQVTNFVVDQMGDAYPELETHREFKIGRASCR